MVEVHEAASIDRPIGRRDGRHFDRPRLIDDGQKLGRAPARSERTRLGGVGREGARPEHCREHDEQNSIGRSHGTLRQRGPWRPHRPPRSSLCRLNLGHTESHENDWRQGPRRGALDLMGRDALYLSQQLGHRQRALTLPSASTWRTTRQPNRILRRVDESESSLGGGVAPHPQQAGALRISFMGANVRPCPPIHRFLPDFLESIFSLFGSGTGGIGLRPAATNDDTVAKAEFCLPPFGR
jgi:hypothetical protein